MIHRALARQIASSLLLIFVIAPISFNVPVYADPVVPIASDLQRDAEMARAEKLVLLLIVSRTDCPYCEVLKREFIRPMIASGDYRQKILIRELMLDGRGGVTDFDGTHTTAAVIASRYDEWLTPTVLFLDPDGVELAKRRRGINTVEFYGHYLDKAIDQALAALR